MTTSNALPLSVEIGQNGSYQSVVSIREHHYRCDCIKFISMT